MCSGPTDDRTSPQKNMTKDLRKRTQIIDQHTVSNQYVCPAILIRTQIEKDHPNPQKGNTRLASFKTEGKKIYFFKFMVFWTLTK
jgi:hypothetical protein